MHPNPKLSAVITLALGAGLAAACSSSSISAGNDTGHNYGGLIDAGNGLCGAAACASGQLCCAGSDEFCSPTCMAVSECPVYGAPCKVADGGPPTDSGPPRDGGGVGDAGGALQWYTTCGAPVCEGIPDSGLVDAGLGCPDIGSACTTKGQTCGTASNANCDTTLVCDDHDPKGPSGDMCPISTRKYKTGIDYVDDAELQQLHDEMLGVKLATYKYKGQVADPDPTHLGFIVEDNPQSLAVDRAHHRVDLYGYVSMVVATTQVQEKEIAELRKELEATRKQAASCRASSK